MNRETDVSVLTPSYNYARFIEDAILSVRGQEGVSVQHVVQDGGSSDGTPEVLARFKGEIDWASEPDRGQSEALNRALIRARGRWIGWLNADEFYLPGALDRLVSVGDQTGADVVYGESVLVDEEGRVVRLLPQHRYSTRVLKEYGCYISSNSTIFRRSALGDAPWDVGVRRIMDWDLFMRLTGEGAWFRHLRWPVAAFRVHGGQVTAAPHEHFHEENAVVTSRYGRPADPVDRWKASRIGRILHRALKVNDGAYLRQWRARALRGTDLRWFRGDDQRESTDALVGRCYRSPRGGPHV